MIPLFRVVKTGVYATIQDMGRYKYRRFGMPISGPMDREAFLLGQRIIGNERNGNALELFMGGLSLEVLQNHRIVITGADLGAVIDDKHIAPLWKTVRILKGQRITFTKPVSGAISYIIPEGGFYADEVLGSQSSYPRGLIGEVQKRGSILYANSNCSSGFNKGLNLSKIPHYIQNVLIELFPSPHIHLFKPSSVDAFLDSTYTFHNGDRMGYFLDGPSLEFVDSGDIVSEATQFGTVQVPTNGQPIVLMADSQTTGGYATIGTVIKSDLAKIAQLYYGGTIQFKYRT